VKKVVPQDPRREFLRTFQDLTRGRYTAWEIWSDWLVLASSAIYNSVHQDPAIEAQYMAVVGRYDKTQADAMAHLLALVVEDLDTEPGDFLGGIFHELELHNEAKGQFFTPYDLCRMMAATMVPEAPGSGHVLRVGEPACGSGAMVIAFSEVARAAGIEQGAVFYSLRDLDDRAFRMAYIQCSLLGLAAEVERGNTLTMEIDMRWRTPGYYLHDMGTRLMADELLRLTKGDGDGSVGMVPGGSSMESAEPTKTNAPLELASDVTLPQPEQMELFA